MIDKEENKMKKSTKFLGGVLLSLVLVISVLPAVPAEAAGGFGCTGAKSGGRYGETGRCTAGTQGESRACSGESRACL